MTDKTIKKDHNIIIENRQSMSISGITDVDSFNAHGVNMKFTPLYCEFAKLCVKAYCLHER